MRFSNAGKSVEEHSIQCVVSLTYHISMGDLQERWQAFPYAVRAAEVSIFAGSYLDALSFLQFSFKIARDKKDLRKLLGLVKSGMKQIEAGMSIGEARSDEAYLTLMQELLNQYADLREDISMSPLLIFLHIRLGSCCFCAFKYCF
jgi:hypothetical protein